MTPLEVVCPQCHAAVEAPCHDRQNAINVSLAVPHAIRAMKALAGDKTIPSIFAPESQYAKGDPK